MTIPRCTVCDRIAIIEIDTGVFLCKRCETILEREFPNFKSSFSGADTAGTAAADAEPAPCIAAANQFPDMPEFLRRTAA